MTRIDKAFTTLSHKMGELGASGRSPSQPESIASLLDKVNAAKLRYQPGAMR